MPDWSFGSGPFWSDPQRVREAAVAEIVRARALELARSPIVRARCPDLLPPLAALAERSSFGAEAWLPALGSLGPALPPEDAEPCAALNLLFAFIEHVPAFKVQVALSQPTPVLVSPVLLPKVLKLYASWDGARVSVAGPALLATVVVGGRRRGTLTAAGTAAGGLLLSAAGELRTLCHAGAGLFAELGDPDPLEQRTLAHEVGSACALIADCAPEYLRWLKPMICCVVPLQAPPAQYTSGSGSHVPGLIGASIGMGPATIAESIVHEGSHQYAFLVQRYGPLSQAHDRLYYSPLAKRERPLEKLLFALHAAANIAVLYDRIARHHERLAPCVELRERNAAECREMIQSAADNPQLTPLGHMLIDPIVSYVREHSLV